MRVHIIIVVFLALCGAKVQKDLQWCKFFWNSEEKEKHLHHCNLLKAS
jgi:hypothetical protein